MDRLFDQPTLPVAIATLLAALLSVMLQFVLNRRSRKFSETLQRHGAELAERNAATAAALAELREIELNSRTIAKLIDHIDIRAQRLHGEFAELLALLDAHCLPAQLIPSESGARVLYLCRSISISLPPRGKFAEELNVQLGHVQQAVQTEPLTSSDWQGLIEALRYNAWKVTDVERDRIQESLLTGRLVEGRDIQPTRWIRGSV